MMILVYSYFLRRKEAAVTAWTRGVPPSRRRRRRRL